MSFSIKFQKEIARALTALAPGIPYADAEAVRAHATSRHLRSFPPGISVWLSLVAHIRHQHTDYDALLSEGYDAESARHFVLGEINQTLTHWRATRLVSEEDSA